MISCVAKSNGPPSCGVVSSIMFNKPVSVSVFTSHCDVEELYFKTELFTAPDVSTSFNSPNVSCVCTVSYTHLTLPTIYSV